MKPGTLWSGNTSATKHFVTEQFCHKYSDHTTFQLGCILVTDTYLWWKHSKGVMDGSVTMKSVTQILMWSKLYVTKTFCHWKVPWLKSSVTKMFRNQNVLWPNFCLPKCFWQILESTKPNQFFHLNWSKSNPNLKFLYKSQGYTQKISTYQGPRQQLKWMDSQIFL